MDPKSELYTSAATVRSRPGFAVQPGPGQESVWDYPRPPAILRDGRLVEVRDGHAVVATSKGAYKVMETASPPTFYIPAADIDFDLVVPVADTTYCEWKGTATYWALARNPAVLVGWCYERPRPRFDIIKGYLAFYPGRVDCCLGGEAVTTQAGRFYGGWITSEVVGPFKGEPGTGHW
ncbi:MAG: DUF427 domain-containing protein [Woeseiaceae bacterium]